MSISGQRINRLFWTAMDWLYPPHCGGCGTTGSRWCQDCDASVLLLEPPYCGVCGMPRQEIGVCDDCRSHPPLLTGIRSWGWYAGPLRHALIELKFENKIDLGEVFADKLFELYLHCNWQIDHIIPIPVSRSRRFQRGYNQVELIAKPLSDMSNIPYKPTALKRIKDTESQVRLSHSERIKNVQDAFVADSSEVDQSACLLVDDIVTTGATLENATKALLAAGASSVYALTVARAGRIPGDDNLTVDNDIDSM